MKQSWNDYERSISKGPMNIVMKIVIFFFLISIPIGVLSYTCGLFHETAQVAQEEFGPKALLQKYSWFKDAAAQLDKKIADISVYEKRFQSLEEMYKDTPRNQWPRDDREQYNIWQSEVSGIRASYNSLAADYNSNMAKFNWRFTNVGDLPQGATEVLPREFKPYKN